jgi:Flp pilus assembly CpaF family ATPase
MSAGPQPSGPKRFATLEEARKVESEYRSFLGEAEQLLDDKNITDIYRNPQDPLIWVMGAQGKRRTEYQQTIQDAERFIATVVAFYNKEFSARHPFFENVLPYNGARFTAWTAPLTPQGVSWIIRKPTAHVPTLESYLESGIISDDEILKRIRRFIAEKLNVLVAGPQGAGKTTLLNAMLAEMSTLFKGRERYALIEDTDELRCPDPDHIKMMTVPDLEVSPGVFIDYPFLIKRALRSSTTRVIVGELRDGASVLMDAWRTGHPGSLATIHGGTPTEVMSRLEFLLRREGFPIDRREIMATIHGIVCMRKVGSGRVIRDVVRISGINEHGYVFKEI